MATLYHPTYGGLRIYEASKYEVARAGAFFVTRSGMTLSHIAKQAYGDGKLGATLRINKSQWNRENCVYRLSSTSCKSKVVAGILALSQSTWDSGAWLALCPGDKNALATQLALGYPVIWVPTVDGKEPWDFAVTPIPTSPIGTVKMPDLSKLIPGIKGALPGLGDEDEPEKPGEPEPEPEPIKAGFPWWVAVIVAGTIIGTALYVNREGKK
jgi:hypothetical protein